MYSEWSECSAVCGTGTRQRKPICKVDNANATSMCQDSKKDVLSEPCNTQKCGEWRPGKWGPCSRTCGHGIRKRCYSGVLLFLISKLRIFNCFVKTEANIWAQVASDVANKHCTRNAPNEGGTCYKGPCPAVWKYGKWSECSTSCGTGKRTKMGICTKNGKRTIGCDKSERIIEENCNTHACPVWEVIGDWSKCTAGCGRGTKKR